MSIKRHLVTFVVEHDDRMSEDFIESRVRKQLEETNLEVRLMTINKASDQATPNKGHYIDEHTHADEYCPACGRQLGED